MSEAALAGHLHRLAVLIASGVSPRAAWGHTAGAADPADPVLTAVAHQLDSAADPALDPAEAIVRAAPHGVRGDAWRSLAAAWRVAADSGAPLAPALRAYAEGLRDRESARRDIAVALAGPRATARIVLVLPAIAILLGVLMGVDLVATIASPLGAGSLIAGLFLLVVARRWMRSLLRSAEPPPSTVGLALDLLAVAAGGGGAPEAAAERVARELARVGDGTEAGDNEGDARHRADDAQVRALVNLSRQAGAPLGELARAEASEARARARADAREGAESLAVRLMLPLGACILPSFLLLGVVPIVLGLLSSTSLGP